MTLRIIRTLYDMLLYPHPELLTLEEVEGVLGGVQKEEKSILCLSRSSSACC